jgi:hypothetical protein
MGISRGAFHIGDRSSQEDAFMRIALRPAVLLLLFCIVAEWIPA